MQLIQITAFIHTYTAAPHPDPRTVRRWPGARKVGGRWYVDIDEWSASGAAENLYQSIVQADPEIAAMVAGA